MPDQKPTRREAHERFVEDELNDIRQHEKRDPTPEDRRRIERLAQNVGNRYDRKRGDKA